MLHFKYFVMRIPGIGRINKKLSSYFGNSSKSKFEKFIRTKDFGDELKKKLRSKVPVNLDLVTFADSKSFPDLLLSMLSFISSVGLPAKWTIYMDDEFSAEQKNIFDAFEFIVCKYWFENVPDQDRGRYNSRWQYRKYLSFSTHAITKTTVFLDSDVLFYEAFNKYKEYVKESNWYLPEPIVAFSIDDEIIGRNEYKPNMFIVNAGFMIINQMPPWDLGLQYLDECFSNNSKRYFIDQSALNIVYANDSSAKILDPRVFHISTVDHFKLGFLKTNDLAIRHYVGLIRFKMWQSGWRKFI